MAELTAIDFRFMGEMQRYDAFLHLYHAPGSGEAAVLERWLDSRDPLVPLILLQYLEEVPEKKSMARILRLIESDNEVVARAAMGAYRKNHYPGKARLLKQLILSPNARACRFAVRTLSRAGYVDALPLILRDLPEREGAVRAEMIDALRFLPDRRTIPVLLPFADSSDEPTRFLALQVLAELHLRFRALSTQFFLRHASADSERIRRVALEALQRLPTRPVARLFLEQALNKAESETVRERAVRALAAFPSREWIEPLTRLLAAPVGPAVKLATEVALRGLPEGMRRKGLLLLLAAKDPNLRREAALILAEHHGREPAVRRRLVALWRGARGAEALELIDVVREVGGAEGEELLLEALRSSPLVAYAAGEALVRILGPAGAPRVLEVLRDPATSHLTKQAVLGHWAKRGPAEAIRAEVLPWLSSALLDDILNVRYLALLTLGWYPLEHKLKALLDLLARETSADVVRAAYKQILRGLGLEPMPLLRAAGEHARRPALVSHVVRLLTSQSWDPARIFDLLHALATPPWSLSFDAPESFFAVCVHLMERGGVTLEKVWLFLDDENLQMRFLLVLLSFMRSPRRHFPPLPIDFLSFQLASAERAVRPLFFELLQADGRRAGAEALAAALLREKDPTCREQGAACLRRMLAGPSA